MVEQSQSGLYTSAFSVLGCFWESYCIFLTDLQALELVDLLFLDIFDCMSIVALYSECKNIVALSIIKVAQPWSTVFL